MEGDPEINLRADWSTQADNHLDNNDDEHDTNHSLSGTQGRNATSDTVRAELGLLTELGGPSMEVDPTDFMRFTFITPDNRGVPTKTTVVEVDEEMGKILIEYAHGQEEWVLPNIIQEAMLSREDDGAGLWTFKEILAHRSIG